MTYFFVGQYYMLDPFLVTGCLDYLQNRQTSAATTNIIVILGNSTSTKMTLADTCKLVPASKVYLQQCKTSAIWMQNSQLAVTKLCMCNVHFNNHRHRSINASWKWEEMQHKNMHMKSMSTKPIPDSCCAPAWSTVWVGLEQDSTSLQPVTDGSSASFTA